MKLIKWFSLSGKLCLIFGHIINGLIELGITRHFYSRKTKFKRIQRWSKRTFKLLGITVVPHNMPEITGDKGLMFVGNHISWLDIFALNGILPGRFIAKSDLKKWPLLGHLITGSETILIDRGGSLNNKKYMTYITDCLKDGDQITLFPEGTTTPGDSMLKFKNRILQAPIDANIDIIPMVFVYPKKDGNGLNYDFSYCGDINFMQSLVKILQHKNETVHIYFLEKHTNLQQYTRTELADLLHDQMSEFLDQTLQNL